MTREGHVHRAWRSLLEEVSAAVLQERDEFEEDLPADSGESGSLGSDGASDNQIAEAEKRLGVTLPPGYRAFLETTNGFGPVGLFVRRLRPVYELTWLKDEDSELVEIWAEEGGLELGAMLVVSDQYDGARVLLNPAVRDAEGEWEASFFADWVPGAEEVGSFRQLVEHTSQDLVRLRKAERGEPTPRASPALRVAADDLDGLVRALGDPDADRRVEALEALGELRDPAATPAVVAVVEDAEEDEYIRQTAARTLGQLRDEGAVTALLEVLRTAASAELKHAARQGLLQPPVAELAREALAAALDDQDPRPRADACHVVCYARSWADAFDLVAPLAADPDADVRLTLVTHVAQLGDPCAVELLHAARSDRDPRVRARAEETLEWLDPQ